VDQSNLACHWGVDYTTIESAKWLPMAICIFCSVFEGVSVVCWLLWNRIHLHYHKKCIRNTLEYAGKFTSFQYSLFETDFFSIEIKYIHCFFSYYLEFGRVLFKFRPQFWFLFETVFQISRHILFKSNEDIGRWLYFLSIKKRKFKSKTRW